MTGELQRLFSYGTLQSEDVQLAIFGRTLEGESDLLSGYVVTKVPNQAQPEGHHLNIEFTGDDGDVVIGSVLLVTNAELDLADTYEEAAEYKRIRVNTKKAKDAWVYHYAPLDKA